VYEYVHEQVSRVALATPTDPTGLVPVVNQIDLG